MYKLAGALPAPVARQAGRISGRHAFLSPLVNRTRPSGVVTIRRGEGAGLRIWGVNANVGYALGTTEPVVQAALADHLGAGDVFYDIGANVGFFSLIAARRVGPSGRVYAFEPLPDNVAGLERNLALNALSNLDIIDAAVSDTNGRARLQVGHSPLDARLTDYKQDREGDEIPVRTVQLDGLGLRPPTLVKIDAEGAEFAVLAGMRETIREHQPVILCEMHNYGSAYLDEFRAALGEDARRYHVRFLEQDLAQDAWAPHVLATPR